MKLEDFWNNCDNKLTHLDLPENKVKEIIERFENYLIDRINLDNKTVIEYGVGNGYLTEYLLKKFNIKKYACYDISDNVLKAVSRLNVITKKSTNKFTKCDVFLSFACIQHFPKEEYLNAFLERLNNSNAKEIHLQTREGDKRFNASLENEKSVYHACIIPNEYITERLSNYELTYKSEILKGNNYIYLSYKKKPLTT